MKYILLTIFSMLVASSCMKTDIDENINVAPKSTMQLHLSSPSTKIVGAATRGASGANELTIYRGYIFAFTSSGEYIGFQKIASSDVQDNNSQYPTIETKINNYNASKDKLIAVFNYCDSYTVDETKFAGIKKEDISDLFTLDKDYLALLQTDFASGTYSRGMPMYVNDFDNRSGSSVHEVYRALSRIELYVKDTDVSTSLVDHSHSFTTDNVKFTVVNSASNGTIGYKTIGDMEWKDGGDIHTAGSTLTFDKRATKYDPTKKISSYKSSENAIYLYEFPYSTRVVNGNSVSNNVYSPERLSIIIEHEDKVAHPGTVYYYKLQLVDKTTNEYYNIKRNHDYRIVIKDVYSDGYTDVDEAYLMPPSNIEYEVFDDKGDLTFSNGQYAISMDEVLNYESVTIYGPETTELSFSNIRRILPNDVTEPLTDEQIKSMTNIVEFSYKVPDPRPQWDADTIKVNVVQNDFSGSNNKLTDDGKSIKLEIMGEGECTIKLKIKLGNLELGFDEIKIIKIGNDDFGGDSSFDAHPGQLRIENQNYVKGTWNSPDSDFGARNDGDDMIVYMGENATPVGYKTLNGYITAGSATNAYPYFEPKTRVGYFTYFDLENDPNREHPKKSKIVLNQLAPFYVGHFGSLASSGAHYYNALIVEKIEEIKDYSWMQKETGGVMSWSEASSHVYYEKDKIWGSFLGLEKYLNFTEGRKISEHIVLNNTTEGSLPSAAHYCYMKNDIDGDGVIGPNEPVVWYLPAANQMMAMWISKHLIDSEVDSEYFGFNLRYADNPWYWTCSEVAGSPADITDKKFEVNVASFNMLEGELSTSRRKGTGGYDDTAHVRCVRGIRYDNK